jgi:hypothetical protein
LNESKYEVRHFIITIALVLLLSCSTSKPIEAKTRYFDDNNVEISKSKFEELRATNKVLEIPGDSINHKKLTQRGQRGQIDNRAALELALEQATQTSIDSDKPIVIMYYPGKDPCNSSGSPNRDTLKVWHDELEKGVYEIAKVKPIYLYKNKTGLKKLDGKRIWSKDPDSMIERLFFKYHYPCFSFVVISKEGNFVSYFGEFGKEYVWGALKMLNE